MYLEKSRAGLFEKCLPLYHLPCLKLYLQVQEEWFALELRSYKNAVFGKKGSIDGTLPESRQRSSVN